VRAGLATGSCRKTFTLVFADSSITFRLPSERKALLHRLAAREGITDSAFVTRVLDRAIGTISLADVQAPAAADKVIRDTRLHVCLAAEDWGRLKARAKARRLAPATYAAFLMRAHLGDAPPLPEAEYLALKDAITEVTAIGRNLNQIARGVHSGEQPALPGRAEVRAMIRVAKGLRNRFKALLDANERAWRTDAKKSP
jgi:predicted DNA binding CopG/RHH family protein